MQEAVGWLSSAILIATIGKQVHKQWKSRTADGVSSWLFLGQCCASFGFTIYSMLLHNWVFVVTNSVMLASAITGLFIYRRNRRLTSSSQRLSFA
jgi:MtN3 and saliva related transmembrane protein